MEWNNRVYFAPGEGGWRGEDKGLDSAIPSPRSIGSSDYPYAKVKAMIVLAVVMVATLFAAAAEASPPSGLIVA